MAVAPDPWHAGDPYERFMGRWSRQLAPRFLAWLGVPAAQRWLDVGCGTGALSAAVLAQCAPASVVGIDPSEGFLARAGAALGDRVALHIAPAGRIPLPKASVDATVSALVLNFVPDPPAALAEMARVTAGGGLVAACVWDYAGTMDLLRHFWDAAAELDPEAAAVDEGVRFPLCRPNALAELFSGAGLAQVEVAAIHITMHLADVDDYWLPFLGGQGPAPGYAMSLSEPQRARLRERTLARIAWQPDGSAHLAARAWAVRGRVPA